MSEMAARVRELSRARTTPALALLNHKYSAVVLTLLEEAFGQDSAAVPAERLHALVEAGLAELAEAGLETPPQHEGRALCLFWTQEQWLTRLPTDDGGEEYERTWHAHVAQRMLDELGRERALLNQSRLTTIMETASRWASQARPGHDARADYLRARLAATQAELTALEAQGEPDLVDDEVMMHGYADLADLLAQLPGDFRRVEESIARIHREMLAAFRADERPRGEVLDAYLESSAHLMERTEEGRAFSSALALLGDEDVLRAFRDDLRAILEHPFARSLTPEARRGFLNAAGLLRRGLYEVQARQHKASRALADQLQRADASGDRAVARLLQRVQAELGTWMLTARPRDGVSLSRMPGRAEVSHLRSRVFDPTPPPPVEALQDVSAAAPSGPDLERVRLSGGPLSGPVRLHVKAALEAGQADTLGSVFETLPDELRRPVELYGLMDLAAPALTAARFGVPAAPDAPDRGSAPVSPEATNALPGARTAGEGTPSGTAYPGPTERVRTVRPDGTERWLRLPAVRLSADHLTPGDGGTTPPPTSRKKDPA